MSPCAGTLTLVAELGRRWLHMVAADGDAVLAGAGAQANVEPQKKRATVFTWTKVTLDLTLDAPQCGNSEIRIVIARPHTAQWSVRSVCRMASGAFSCRVMLVALCLSLVVWRVSLAARRVSFVAHVFLS